jgi:hypothetical protein
MYPIFFSISLRGVVKGTGAKRNRKSFNPVSFFFFYDGKKKKKNFFRRLL